MGLQASTNLSGNSTALGWGRLPGQPTPTHRASENSTPGFKGSVPVPTTVYPIAGLAVPSGAAKGIKLKHPSGRHAAKAGFAGGTAAFAPSQRQPVKAGVGAASQAAQQVQRHLTHIPMGDHKGGRELSSATDDAMQLHYTVGGNLQGVAAPIMSDQSPFPASQLQLAHPRLSPFSNYVTSAAKAPSSDESSPTRLVQQMTLKAQEGDLHEECALMNAGSSSLMPQGAGI